MYQEKKSLDRLHGMHSEWIKKVQTKERVLPMDHFINKGGQMDILPYIGHNSQLYGVERKFNFFVKISSCLFEKSCI